MTGLVALALLGQLLPPPLSQGSGKGTGGQIVNAHNGVFNVLDYGALCNGATDDTVALRAAFAAAGIGGTITFPGTGCCMVSNSLTVQSQQHLTGSDYGGTNYNICVVPVGLPANTPVLNLSNTVGVQIESVGIEGSYTASGYTGAACVLFTGGSQNSIFGGHFNNCDYGINTAAGPTNLALINVFANQNSASALQLNGVSYGTIQGGTYGTSDCQGSPPNGNLVIQGGSVDINVNGAYLDEATTTASVGCSTLNIQAAKRVTIRYANIWTGLASSGITIGDGVAGDTDMIRIYDTIVRPWNVGPVSNNIVIEANATGVVLEHVETTCILETGAVSDGGDCVVPTDGGVEIYDNGVGTVFVNVNGQTKNLPGLNTLGGIATTQLATPAAPTLVSTATGGTLLHSTQYCYTEAAVDVNGQTTAASPQACVTTSAGADTYSIKATASVVPGAQSYILGGRTAGSQLQMGGFGGGYPSGNEIIDTNSVSPAGAMPAVNNTGGVVAGTFTANNANVASFTAIANTSGESFVSPDQGYYCANGAACTEYIQNNGSTLTIAGGTVAIAGTETVTGHISTSSTTSPEFGCTGAAACNAQSASGQTMAIDCGGGTCTATLGGTNATTTAIGRSGQTTTINGTATVSAGDLTVTTGDVIAGGEFETSSTTTPQFSCTGAATCTIQAVSGQNLNLVTSGGGAVQVNGTSISSTTGGWSGFCNLSPCTSAIADFIGGYTPTNAGGKFGSITCESSVAGVGAGNNIIKIRDCGASGSINCATGSDLCSCTLGLCTGSTAPQTCTCGTAYTAGHVYEIEYSASSNCATSNPGNVFCNVEQL